MFGSGSWQKALYAFISALIAASASACSAAAQVRQIKTISIGSPRPSWTFLDLSGYFEQSVLAVTQSGDLLMFFARPDGNWQLYRVRGWSGSGAAVKRLILPGYFSSRERDHLESLEAHLFVTPDGRYVVCVATAEWQKRLHGRAIGNATSDNMITVVDLASFTIANYARTNTLNLYEFQGVNMDRAGRLVVDSLAPGPERNAAFIPLEVPSLRQAPRCAYRYLPVRPGDRDKPVAVTTDTCSRALEGLQLEEYLATSKSKPPQHGFVCSDSRANYCPQPDRFTPDARFGLAVRTEGHDNLLGSWVQTSATAIVFATRTHSEIGELDLVHGAPSLLLASLGGRDYLLVLRRGSELAVYELADSIQRKLP